MRRSWKRLYVRWRHIGITNYNYIMKTIPKKNNFPSVVKSPTPANRRMNANVKCCTTPSKANKSLNPAAKVSPK